MSRHDPVEIGLVIGVGLGLAFCLVVFVVAFVCAGINQARDDRAFWEQRRRERGEPEVRVYPWWPR